MQRADLTAYHVLHMLFASQLCSLGLNGGNSLKMIIKTEEKKQYIDYNVKERGASGACFV